MRMDALSSPIFLKPVSTVKCFDSSIYYCVLILRRLRYVFSKELARSCVCKASNQHCLQSCRCNRCVTVSVGLAKDWFANNSSRYFRAIRQTISLR